MCDVRNYVKFEKVCDEKSLTGILNKLGNTVVRDPYILFNPEETPSKNLTIGYAILYPSCKTNGHTHDDEEEIYHIVRGNGRMTVGDEQFDFSQGDTFIVPINKFHSTDNIGNSPLEIFWTLVRIPD